MLEINPEMNQFKRMFICFTINVMKFTYYDLLDLDEIH